MLNLLSTPRSLTFVYSKAEFVIQADSQTSAGLPCQYLLSVSDTMAVGGSITLTVDGRSLTFTKASAVNSMNAYTFYNTAELTEKLNANYYLSQLFSFSYAYNGITAVGSAAGHLLLSASSSESVLFFSLTTLTEGQDPTFLPNYSVAVQYQYGDSSTPWVHLTPASGEVRVPVDILRSCFPAPAVPGSDTFGTHPTGLPLKYRLAYAECYGSEPTMQRIFFSPWLFALPASICHLSNNLPDWSDARPTAQLTTSSASSFRPFVFGANNNIHAYIAPSDRAYLYVGLFNTHPSAASTYSISLRVDYATEENTSLRLLSDNSLDISNLEINRISISPAALSLPSSTVAYTVRLTDSNGDFFLRSFSIIPDNFNHHRLLVQDHRGILQPISAISCATSITTKGDELHSAIGRIYDITDTEQVHQVVTPRISRTEAERILSCLTRAEYAYYYSARYSQWVRISFQPASYSIWSDTDNLSSVSFSFTFLQPQPSTLPLHSLNPSIT